MPLEPENLRPIIAELGAAKQRDARLLERMEALQQLLERRRSPRLDRVKSFGRENKVSERQIYRMADKGRVKLIRIDGIVFVDVDSWEEEIERARAAQDGAQKAAQPGPPPDDEGSKLKDDVIPPGRDVGKRQGRPSDPPGIQPALA